MPTVDELVMLEHFAQAINELHDKLKTRPKLPKEKKSKEYTFNVSKRINTFRFLRTQIFPFLKKRVRKRLLPSKIRQILIFDISSIWYMVYLRFIFLTKNCAIVD